MFGQQIRHWRKIRRVSQLELSLRSEISSRHISFLETGRSRPSANIIERIADALEIPARDRNDLFVLAGFAPPYAELRTDAETIKPFQRNIDRLLERHAPYPATVFDRWWQVIDGNSVAKKQMPQIGSDPIDTVEIMLAPGNVVQEMLQNYSEVAWSFFERLRADALLAPNDAKLQEIFTRAQTYVQSIKRPRRFDHTDLEVAPIQILPDGQIMHTSVMMARFGFAREIGLQELRVELVFPTDEIGEQFYQQLAKS